MPINNLERKRFIKFGLVGISGTIIDFGIFNVLLFFKFSSKFAYTISFVIAVLNNFYWNRNWTYPESKIHPIKTQLIKFSTVSVAGFLIRTNLYKLIEQPLIIFTERMIIKDFLFSAEVVGKNISLAFVIVVVLFWNYFANRLLTYKDI